MHKKFGFEENGRLAKVGFKLGKWVGVVMLQKSL
jgi:phosphinothricin acetyltransferase